MKSKIYPLNCQEYDKHSKRTQIFNVVVYTFNYQTNQNDRGLLNDLIDKGLQLARSVNPKAANDASLKRDFERIANNCIAGVLAEYLWKECLNRDSIIVQETKYEGAANQIDLEIISSKKKIEVRSSFPRNGIDFAICSPSHEFDVIGMYSNSYKPNEVQKDFYVRTLFHLAKLRDWTTPDGRVVPIIEKIVDKIKQDDFEVYLTGGATWDMMISDDYSFNKTFIPEDEISIERMRDRTSYRVVPFSKALDSEQIYELIKKA